VVLLDESRADDEEILYREWRQWLHLFNVCQFLPGILLTTASGLDEQDYDDLGSSNLTVVSAGAPAASGAWQEVMDQAASPLKLGLAALAKWGAAIPDVGTELADAKGRVIADAELTWGEKRVVLLRPDQSDLAEVWQAQQCLVFQLDDGLQSIKGNPWDSVIASALDLRKDEE
jgi:DEAD/DEAH box helicase domain-containing protein